MWNSTAAGRIEEVTSLASGPVLDAILPTSRSDIPARKNKKDIHCQLCSKDLRTDKPYYRRYRICPACASMESIDVDGIPQRFCQQCGRFHPIALFDGTNRTCRERLCRHAARRRRNNAIARTLRIAAKRTGLLDGKNLEISASDLASLCSEPLRSISAGGTHATGDGTFRHGYNAVAAQGSSPRSGLLNSGSNIRIPQVQPARNGVNGLTYGDRSSAGGPSAFFKIPLHRPTPRRVSTAATTSFGTNPLTNLGNLQAQYLLSTILNAVNCGGSGGPPTDTFAVTSTTAAYGNGHKTAMDGKSNDRSSQNGLDLIASVAMAESSLSEGGLGSYYDSSSATTQYAAPTSMKNEVMKEEMGVSARKQEQDNTVLNISNVLDLYRNKILMDGSQRSSTQASAWNTDLSRFQNVSHSAAMPSITQRTSHPQMELNKSNAYGNNNTYNSKGNGYLPTNGLLSQPGDVRNVGKSGVGHGGISVPGAPAGINELARHISAAKNDSNLQELKGEVLAALCDSIGASGGHAASALRWSKQSMASGNHGGGLPHLQAPANTSLAKDILVLQALHEQTKNLTSLWNRQV